MIPFSSSLLVSSSTPKQQQQQHTSKPSATTQKSKLWKIIEGDATISTTTTTTPNNTTTTSALNQPITIIRFPKTTTKQQQQQQPTKPSLSKTTTTDTSDSSSSSLSSLLRPLSSLLAPPPLGPFLTVQRLSSRNSRQRLKSTHTKTTMNLLHSSSLYQITTLLNRIGKWEFNAFTLDYVTGGKINLFAFYALPWQPMRFCSPLPYLCVHLLKTYDLISTFNLDPVVLWKLFATIQSGYHWRNPYHNAVHAADVTQAMHCFLQEKFLLDKLTKLEIFAAILAAVSHDLDHPGVNQPFLIATSNHLAALYKNSSVLENHHWRSAMGCLNESGVSQILGPKLTKEVEEQVKSLVLATDITRQQEFIDRLKDFISTPCSLDLNLPSHRHFILQICLKCADICNPCRPWEVSRKWSMKVCEEFFRQGDYERQLELPVTPMCDRYGTSVPKIQSGFLTYIVLPLFTHYSTLFPTPLSTLLMSYLHSNSSRWEALLSSSLDMDIPQHIIVEDYTSDEIGLDVAKIKSKQQQQENREQQQQQQQNRSVRFEIRGSDDSTDSSDSDDMIQQNPSLLLPPVKLTHRRHSIAITQNTNIGENVKIKENKQQQQSTSTSTATITGKTTYRRESLPSAASSKSGQFSTKVLLHLEKIKSEESIEQQQQQHNRKQSLKKHSTSSRGSSTTSTEELLDLANLNYFNEIDEEKNNSSLDDNLILSKPTSILSMSEKIRISSKLSSQIDNVVQEEQRRHLIRQQTCPLVDSCLSQFSRPRFLSAAAALSPSSSSQLMHKSQENVNLSKDSSRGSSSENLIVVKEVEEENEDKNVSSEFSQKFTGPGSGSDNYDCCENLRERIWKNFSNNQQQQQQQIDQSNVSEINKPEIEFTINPGFPSNLPRMGRRGSLPTEYIVVMNGNQQQQAQQQQQQHHQFTSSCSTPPPLTIQLSIPLVLIEPTNEKINSILSHRRGSLPIEQYHLLK